MPLTTSAGSYRPISRKLPDAVADRDHMLNKNTGEAVINKSSRETLYTRCNPFAADKLLKYQFRLLSGVCAEICLPWQLTPCDSIEVAVVGCHSCLKGAGLVCPTHIVCCWVCALGAN
jgi:hypothetical protein